MAEEEEVIVKKLHVDRLPEEPTGKSTTSGDVDELDTPDDAIEPPAPLGGLANWSQMNGVRRACIEAIARNTVGLGYTIEVAEGHEREVQDASKDVQQATATIESLARRDKRLDKPSFTELLFAVKTDEEEVGQGYIEVARDKTTGAVSGLFHVPAKRVRRRKDRKGWMLLPPDGDSKNATQFVNFGEKVTYTRDGKPTKGLAPGARGWGVNELLTFRLYTSESRDYGLPRDVALALEYLGDKHAAEANVSFFNSSGTPPTVLFVQGEERSDGRTVNVRVPAETSQRIASTMKSGGDRSSVVAVIPIPQGAKVQKEELGKLNTKDMGHVEFRDDMRQRTLSAFRMSPIFIALGGEGRYGAEVDRAITKEQVFDPEQSRYETRLHDALLRELGYDHLAISFRDLAVEDDAVKRSSADKRAETGTITRRDYNAAHGAAPYPEAAKSDETITFDGEEYQSAEPEPGQVPYGWNDRLVKIGRAEGGERLVPEGAGQQGLKPGSGGRDSRNDGQAESAVEGATRRLATRNGARGARGARRALERARALPEEE